MGKSNPAVRENVHIRWMIRRDLPDVLEVENASFDQPWREEDFLYCLRKQNCIGMVAEKEDKVVAYMVYELRKAHLRIVNLAVHLNHRRHGIGTKMAAKLAAKLDTHRRIYVDLVTRESNLPAQLFFRACDFRAVRVVRGCFGDTGEDGIRMEYRLASAPSVDHAAVTNRIAAHFRD